MTDVDATPAQETQELKKTPREDHSDEESKGNGHKHDDDNNLNNSQDNVDAPTPIGVVPDISNLSIKHPLQNNWVLWYDNPGKRTSQASWGDYLKKVTDFDTVEDFWRMFNNVKPASSLQSGSNYHLFKENIEPKWEDAANAKGGKWTVPIPRNRKDMVDTMWLYAILGCIGESFEEADDVCGIVVSLRKAQDRICLWTKDWRNEAAVKNIGRQLKAMLELPENTVLGYQSHEDSSKTKSTKDRYSV